MDRQTQIAWILGNFNLIVLMGLTRDRAHYEGVPRQAAFQPVLQDAKVFKVLLDLYQQLTHDPHIKLYDINTKVMQKLARHLALDKAKRLST